MALTKQRKSEMISDADKKMKLSKSLVFAEFKGVLVEDFKKLRRELKKAGADLKIVKKRLLNLALKKSGVEFNPALTKNQLGTIFSKSDLSGVAPMVYKFSKELAKLKRGEFAVLGAYDAGDNRVIDSNEFKAIATLPPREVLLAQIAMMLTMPLKQVMMALNEKAKKV